MNNDLLVLDPIFASIFALSQPFLRYEHFSGYFYRQKTLKNRIKTNFLSQMLRKNIQMVTQVRGILDGFFSSFIPSICTQNHNNLTYSVVLTTIKIRKYLAQLESYKNLVLSICNLRKIFMEYLAQLESSKILLHIFSNLRKIFMEYFKRKRKLQLFGSQHLQFAKTIHGIFNAI